MKKIGRRTLSRKTSTFLLAIGLSLTLVIPLVCGTAMGQDATKSAKTDKTNKNENEYMLQEVTVTAQFHKQNVQNTPIALTAVNSEMMHERDQTNLSSIAGQAPNVTLIETGGAFGPGMSASIRGVGAYDFNPAYEPGVGIYIDDVYYPSLSGANFDLLDLDRVEIARGPQGVLGGRNSEGGSIKLYTQKPKGDGSGSFRATFGSRDLQAFRAMADLSVVKDKLFLRLSSVSKKQDGYQKRYDYGCLHPNSGIPDTGEQGDCLMGKQGGKDYTAGRAAFRWLASDALEVNLTADYSMDNSEPAALTLQYSSRPDAKMFVPADPYITYATYTIVPPDGRATLSQSPNVQTRVWGTNLTADWKIADSMALNSITAYRRFDSRWATDSDNSPLSLTWGAEHLFNHSLSQELRLNGKLFEEAVNYTLGGYYFDETTTYAGHEVLDYAGPAGMEFRQHDPVGATSYAGFFNATWHITDKMNLNAGLRYTKEKKDYHYVRKTVGNSPTLGVEALDGVVAKFEGSKVDYRINLDYRFTDNIMAYANVATGFKGGGTNPRPFGPGQAVPFGEEDLTAYEIGAKTDFLDKRLRVNVAAFLNYYNDIQLALRICPNLTPTVPCAAIYNAGDAKIKGAELEVTAAPIDGLLINLSASKLNFEYTSVNPSTGLTVGQRAPYLIQDKYSAGAQYAIYLNNGSTVTPRLDYVYQGDFNTGTTFTQYNHVDGYGLLNARLTWSSPDDTWEVSLIGKNLTDKVYYLSNFDQTTTAAGFEYGLLGAPREYAVQLVKKF